VRTRLDHILNMEPMLCCVFPSCVHIADGLGVIVSLSVQSSKMVYLGSTNDTAGSSDPVLAGSRKASCIPHPSTNNLTCLGVILICAWCWPENQAHSFALRPLRGKEQVDKQVSHAIRKQDNSRAVAAVYVASKERQEGVWPCRREKRRCWAG